jgi:chromosome segregation ATPase
MYKRQLVSDINDIVSASRNEARLHCEQTSELTEFVADLQKLVHQEVPEFDSTLASLATLFTDTLSLESKFTDAEERLAEDLNDLSARFDVVFRLSEESDAAEAKVKAAREAIERARKAQADDLARGGGKQARLQFELEAAIKAKGEAIQVAIAKLSEHIDARKRYNRMKARRLNHGYTNLGEVLERDIKAQGDKCGDLATAIGRAREALDGILETPNTDK